MRTDEFDYHLPPELIAQFPAPQRDSSRLLVIHRNDGRIEHTLFSRVEDYLRPGDVLVVNDTKVMPVRITGRKDTGGRVDVLLLKPLANGEYPPGKNAWEALITCSRKPRIGSWLSFGLSLQAEVIQRKEGGLWDLHLAYDGDFNNILEQIGETPLPPYIRREDGNQDANDRRRYQTIFARKAGSVAAPTAGLHFAEDLIRRIRQKGVEILTVTLHVGLGTFQPVRVEDIRDHSMHREFYEVNPETAQRIMQATEKSQRIIAVGTTSVRVIETLKRENAPLRGHTNLFIYPGYTFKNVWGLITNFHLPRSTLLMLVAAFAGKDLIFKAYREAIAQKYRFYSYGDAMLVI
jgi:S-adenosylmethionine:tRNA ribosyltransferase-isomerase